MHIAHVFYLDNPKPLEMQVFCARMTLEFFGVYNIFILKETKMNEIYYDTYQTNGISKIFKQYAQVVKSTLNVNLLLDRILILLIFKLKRKLFHLTLHFKQTFGMICCSI